MSFLWIRPLQAETLVAPEERRLRDYLDSRAGVSESAASLAAKFDVSVGRCRRILEQLVEEGILHRTEFKDIEPLYSRFPSIARAS